MDLQKGEGKKARNSSSKTSKKKTKEPTADPIENISGDKFIDLANVVLNGLKGGSGHDKQLRGVFKFAVQLQYNRTQANARVAAANSALFDIKELAERRVLGSGESCMLEVSYPKGPGSRQRYACMRVHSIYSSISMSSRLSSCVISHNLFY
jgi:hypothetical protein